MSDNWTQFFARVQRDVLVAHLDSWCDIEQSFTPADRPAAESAIKDAYAILNLPPPKIAWCGSPQTMALSRAIVETAGSWKREEGASADVAGQLTSFCGPFLKGRIRNELIVESEDRIMQELDINAIIALVKLSSSKGWRADTLSIDEVFGIKRSLYDRAPTWSFVTMNDGRGASMASRLTHALDVGLQNDFRRKTVLMANIEAAVGISEEILGRQLSDSELVKTLQYYELRNYGTFVNLLQRAVIESCYGHLDARFLALPSFFREHHELKWHTDRIVPLIDLARACGGFLPHERVCWLLEKPTATHFDAEGRLHNERGPAIEYADWGPYCWHGVVVDRRIVLEPETLTVKDIETELNLETRRIMLERFGASRFMEESGAVVIDDDPAFGTLYRKNLPRDEALQMVKVKNSTAEPDGSFRIYLLRVPPTMRTAREAVAWTFRMTVQQYQPRVET
jgi:hypothetical protein